MDTVGIVAITTALIGVAGGIWSQVIAFKKDAQRIDRVNETTSNVKSDTAEMKPRVYRTDENVNYMRDCFIKYEHQIQSGINGIQELVESKHIEDEIQNKMSSAAESPQYLKAAIDVIYNCNVSLTEENRMLREEKNILSAENKSLKEQLKLYKDREHKKSGITR